MSIRSLADFNGVLLVGPGVAWRRHRDRPGDSTGGCKTRGEDFYMATSEDIDVATREDFFMAMDSSDA
jgi:hypothetical protein